LRRIFVAVLCAVMIGALSLYAADEKPAPDAQQALKANLDKLIAQLGSQKYEEREAARTELLKIGWDAREALKEALKNPDAEIANAAKEILAEIGPVSVTLVCVDESGKALKKKTVTVAVDYSGTYGADGEYRQPPSEKREGETDENGTFDLGPLKCDRFNFVVEVKGYSPTRRTSTPTYQEGKHVLHVRCVQPGTVKGVVVDADDGDKPIAKALVFSRDDVRVETDEQGRFELESTAPGDTYINVVIQRNDGNGNRIDNLEMSQEVFVRPNATSEMVFKFFGLKGQRPHQSSLKCALLAPDGKPLANVTVVPTAFQTDGNYQYDVFDSYSYHSFATDTNGFAEIPLPRVGEYRMTLYVAGYVPVDLGEHEFKPCERWEIKDLIKLDAGLKIRFAVKDTSGAPVPDAVVVARHAKRGYLRFVQDDNRVRLLTVSERAESNTKPVIPWGQALTDSGGRAEIAGLEEDETIIGVYCKDYVSSDFKTVVLEKGEEEQKLEFTLVKRAHVNVVIRDAETNDIISNATVNVVNEHKNPNGGIYYGFDESLGNGFAPGKRYIFATAPYYLNGYAVGEFASGENPPVMLLLKKIRKGNISGKVEPSKNLPLSKMNYAWIYPLRNIYWHMVITVNDDGTFAVPDLYEGTWEMVLWDIDDNVIGRGTFIVVRDKTTDVKVRLREAGSLRITFPDATEKDRQAAWIWIISAETSGGYSGILPCGCGGHYVALGADKKCSLDSLAESVYLVHAHVTEDGKTRYAGTVLNVKAGQITDAEIALHSNATLKIKGLPASASPWSFILMTNLEEKGDWSSRQTRFMTMSPVGTAEFHALQPGKYRVRAENADKNTFISEIEIGKNDTTKEVELRLPEKLQKFSGYMRNYPYERVKAGSWVMLVGNTVAYAQVRPDGTFAGEAPAGKYKVFLTGGIAVELTENEKNGLKDIRIEDGKDLTGIELR